MSTKILIATQQLRGGVAGKGDDDKPVRFVLEPGAEFTKAAQKALGLDKAGVDDLTARGVLTEVSARTASGDDGEALAAAHAEAKAHSARADAAQARLTLATGLLTDEQKKAFDEAVAKAKL